MRKTAAFLVLLLAGCTPPESIDITEDQLGGPSAVGTSTTWVRTAASDTAEIAAVPLNGRLYTFYRGYDGFLWSAVDLGLPARVPGVPAIGTDGISAAADGSGWIFVVVRTTTGRAVVAQGFGGATALTTWSAVDVGAASGRPALTLSCGNVRLAIPAGGWIWLTDRPISGSTWTPGRALASAPGAPVLTTNNRSEAGLAVVGYDHNVYFWTSACGAGGPTWGGGVRLGAGAVQTADPRVGLAANGPMFAVALRSLGGDTFFLQQQLPPSASGIAGGAPGVTPSWRGEFEKVDPTPRGSIAPLVDVPVVYAFRSLVVVSGRDANGQVIYYVRTPNSLAPLTGDRTRNVGWIGGYPVNGDSMQTAPALAAVGTTMTPNFPTELYAVAQSSRYEGRFGTPQRLTAVNLSRFMTLDFLEGHLNVRFDTRFINNVPKAQIENLFESLLAVLQTPSWMWPAYSLPTGTNTCDTADKSRGITLYPAAGRESVVGCNVGLQYGAKITPTGRSWTIFEELGHHLLERTENPPLVDMPGWHAQFDDLNPRTCLVTSDCGGEPGISCVSIDDPQVGADAHNHATSGKICIGPALEGGTRPVGFPTDYADNNTGHNWIYAFYYARWFGDDLRDLAARDAAAGDSRLQKKYEWVRDNIFGGQVFNGRVANAGSDESQGMFALPAR